MCACFFFPCPALSHCSHLLCSLLSSLAPPSWPACERVNKVLCQYWQSPRAALTLPTTSFGQRNNTKPKPEKQKKIERNRNQERKKENKVEDKNAHSANHRASQWNYWNEIFRLFVVVSNSGDYVTQGQAARPASRDDPRNLMFDNHWDNPSIVIRSYRLPSPVNMSASHDRCEASVIMFATS